MAGIRGKMTTAHSRKLIALILVLGLVLAAAVLLPRLLDDEETPEPRQTSSEGFTLEKRTYNGRTYVERTGITPIVLMGVDRTGTSAEQIGYRSGGQADFILLMVIDSSEKTVSMLHIILFASTLPRSLPSPKRISVRAIRPEIVVSDEEEISTIECAREETRASRPSALSVAAS